MSDEVLSIKLTAREIDLLHQCISTNIETVKRRHDVTGSTADLIQELGELSDDLLEQRFRPGDPDLLIDPVDFAAKHDTDPISIVICDAEINAETATSRAAERRALKFVPPGPLGAKGDKPAPQPSDRSEMQDVDVWDDADPRNW
jgi:hypothetical protein